MLKTVTVQSPSKICQFKAENVSLQVEMIIFQCRNDEFMRVLNGD